MKDKLGCIVRDDFARLDDYMEHSEPIEVKLQGFVDIPPVASDADSDGPPTLRASDIPTAPPPEYESLFSLFLHSDEYGYKP